MTNWMQGSRTTQVLQPTVMRYGQQGPITEDRRRVLGGVIHAVNPDTQVAACGKRSMHVSHTPWPPSGVCEPCHECQRAVRANAF